MLITKSRLLQVIRESVKSRRRAGHRFTNEIGNTIRIIVEQTRDTGTSASDGESHVFDAIKIVVIGPTSTSENTLTRREARVLHDCLGRVLESTSETPE
jgi:hypothetical protein